MTTIARESTAPSVEHKARGTFAQRVAAWLPALMVLYGLLIWPLLFAQSPDTGPVAVAPSPGNASNLLSQIYFPAAFGLALLCWVAASFGQASRFRGPVAWFLCALAIIFVASAAWSVAPDITLRRAILQDIIVSALVLAVLAAHDDERVLRCLFWSIAAVIFVNLGFVAIQAPGPLGYEGVYPQKNGLGAAAALGAIMALHRILAGRGIERITAILMIVVCVVLLELSRSKTSLALAIFVPALAAMTLWASRACRLSVALIVALFVAALTLVYEIGAACDLWDFAAVAQALFGDPTLTARTDIWRFALPMTLRHPILGFGFEAFWQAGFESPSFREAPGFVAKMPHAHNGYIDITLQVGFVGLMLLACLLIFALHATGRVLGRSTLTAYLRLMLILFAMSYNLLETAWFRGFDFVSMAFVVALALGFNPKAHAAERRWSA